MRTVLVGVAVVAGVAAVATTAQAATQSRAGAPFAYTAPRAGSPVLFALSRYDNSLVQVDRTAKTTALLKSRGAVLSVPQLDVWRLRTGAAQSLVPHLERLGALRVIEPQRRLRFFGELSPNPNLDDGDPLLPEEWWVHTVGADTSAPPSTGPVSVTDVDSGIDMTHPEFATRPATTAMNAQTTMDQGEWHGTAVSSVAAAPANGVGVVGVYPTSAYRMWDASPFGELTNDDEVRGILAAAAAGPTVINLSLGADSRDPLEQQAVLRAFGAGSLVVAASGNSGDEGNALEYPAVLPHVLTVGASTEANAAADFSSYSSATDLVAPGVHMPVAVPLSADPSGYDTGQGTSFAAPLVSGAAAWVANMRPGMDVTQLFQLMRGSARDIGPRGYDKESGFGLLDIPAALGAAIPASDPQEPNDDIAAVRAKGLFPRAKPPLTTLAKRSAALKATMDFTEDPEDVYRVVVPAHRTLVATMTPSANLNLTLWGPRTTSVFEDTRAALKRDMLASSEKAGRKAEKAAFKNRANAPRTVYADVWIPQAQRPRNASYTLRVYWR